MHDASPCIPRGGAHGVWLEGVRCPSAVRADVLKRDQQALLRAADVLVDSGLAARGFRTVTADGCGSLAREPAVSRLYSERGLALVLAPRERALDPDEIVLHTPPNSSFFSQPRPEPVSKGARHGRSGVVAEQGCEARVLANSSGTGGWNDPDALIGTSNTTAVHMIGQTRSHTPAHAPTRVLCLDRCPSVIIC